MDGARNKIAYLWFAGAAAAAAGLTIGLARIDRWMYDHNGEFLDNQAYRANRMAATALRGDLLDARQDHGLAEAVHALEDKR